MSYSYPAPSAEYAPKRARSSGALIAADIIALVGIIVGCIVLFAPGWVNAKVSFPSSGGAGSQILQQIGLDVNQELARIANREIAATISPTMWAQKGHGFQILFALLAATGVLLILGLVIPRARVIVHILAMLTSVGAALVMTIALIRLREQTDSLPARVAQTALSSQIASRAFALTTGKPQLDASPGWPIYVATACVAIVLLGVLLALVFAALRSPHNAPATHPYPQGGYTP